MLSLHVPIVLEYLLQQHLDAHASTTDDLDLAAQLLRSIPATTLSHTAGESENANTDGSERKWTDLVYGSANPNLQELVAQAKISLPPRLVVKIFQLSNFVLARHTIDTLAMLRLVEITGAFIDAESPSLRNVQGRAWLGRIIKSLPAVSHVRWSSPSDE